MASFYLLAIFGIGFTELILVGGCCFIPLAVIGAVVIFALSNRGDKRKGD